jgi:Polysaccharide deacetylase
LAELQITIDDGPEPVRTALNPILDELAARSLVAAFFNLGEEVKANPGATQMILRRGHVLGNHSWDHLMRHTRIIPDNAGACANQEAVAADSRITHRKAVSSPVGKVCDNRVRGGSVFVLPGRADLRLYSNMAYFPIIVSFCSESRAFRFVLLLGEFQRGQRTCFRKAVKRGITELEAGGRADRQRSSECRLDSGCSYR